MACRSRPSKHISDLWKLVFAEIEEQLPRIREVRVILIENWLFMIFAFLNFYFISISSLKQRETMYICQRRDISSPSCLYVQFLGKYALHTSNMPWLSSFWNVNMPAQLMRLGEMKIYSPSVWTRHGGNEHTYLRLSLPMMGPNYGTQSSTCLNWIQEHIATVEVAHEFWDTTTMTEVKLE